MRLAGPQTCGAFDTATAYHVPSRSAYLGWRLGACGPVITPALTPGGDRECTVVRPAAELRDPDHNGRMARGRARRALRQLLKHFDAYAT